MLVQLAWPCVALVAIAVAAWVFRSFFVSEDEAASLRHELERSAASLIVFKTQADATTAKLDAVVLEIHKLRAEVEKVTLAKAFGRAG
jgi:hypothetical protein